VLLALCAALGLVSAGCGSEKEDGGGGSSGEAKALLERAFERPVASGDLRLDLRADLEGVEPLAGPVDLTVEGPSDQTASESSPRSIGTSHSPGPARSSRVD